MREDQEGGVSGLLVLVVMMAGLIAALWLAGEPLLGSLLADQPVVDSQQDVGSLQPPRML